MAKYLVKYSMVAYWEEEVEAEDVEEASWIPSQIDFELPEEPNSWDDFSVDSVVDLATGKEVEIVTTYMGKELPNRYKGEEA